MGGNPIKHQQRKQYSKLLADVRFCVLVTVGDIGRCLRGGTPSGVPVTSI